MDRVRIPRTVVRKMVRDAMPPPLPYSSASMNGPVPVGSAERMTADFAQRGGMLKTWKAKYHAISGCATSFRMTSSMATAELELSCR